MIKQLLKVIVLEAVKAGVKAGIHEVVKSEVINLHKRVKERKNGDNDKTSEEEKD